MEKSTHILLNKLFTTCGLPEDPPEPVGASFFPIGLSDIPLVQRAKIERQMLNKKINSEEKDTMDKDISSEKALFSCSRCGKSNLSFQDMSKDSNSHRGVKSFCKKCASEAEIVKEKERKESRIIIDFRKIKDGASLMGIITKRAEDNCRTPSAEILFLLKSTGVFSCSGE